MDVVFYLENYLWLLEFYLTICSKILEQISNLLFKTHEVYWILLGKPDEWPAPVSALVRFCRPVMIASYVAFHFHRIGLYYSNLSLMRNFLSRKIPCIPVLFPIDPSSCGSIPVSSVIVPVNSSCESHKSLFLSLLGPCNEQLYIPKYNLLANKITLLEYIIRLPGFRCIVLESFSLKKTAFSIALEEMKSGMYD